MPAPDAENPWPARKQLASLTKLGMSGIEEGDEAKIRQSFDGIVELPYSKERMRVLRQYANMGVGTEEYSHDLERQIKAGRIKEADRTYWAVSKFPKPQETKTEGPRESFGPHTSRIYRDIHARVAIDKHSLHSSGIGQKTGHAGPTEAWKPKGWGKDWDKGL